MSDDRNYALVVIEAKSYGDELLPGAAEELAKLLPTSRVGFLSPAGAAEAVATLIADPLHAGRLRNVEHAPPTTPEGRPVSTLRAALMRHAGKLGPGSVEALHDAWALSLATSSPERIAAEVVRRLGLPANAAHLRVPPPPSETEKLARSVITKFFAEVSYGERAALAARMARFDAPFGEAAMVRHIANYLRYAPGARDAGIDPLGANDPRVNYSPRVEPEPGRRPLVSI